MRYPLAITRKRKCFICFQSLAFFYLVVILAFITSCSSSHYSEPLSPEASVKQFQINDDLKIEIFAAEPFVRDPVDLVFDESGNAFVVEMPDYPYQPQPGKAAGRIRMLSDTNADGRIDKATLFADSLSEATSMLPWKGGLIVTAAPHILYLKDTDGDSRADVKEILFSGFFRNNSEAQITSLRYGIDNWIYANNMGQEGKINYSRSTDTTRVSVRGADFRFRLDRDEFEPETGPGQFGQVIDPWGHRFFNENSIHIQQAVIPWRYLHRNPYLPYTRAVVNISDHDPIMFQDTEPPYWRAERTRRRNEKFQEQKLDRVEYAEDHFTGAAGAAIYTGDLLPTHYHGNVFTGDVAGSLVHRDVLNLLHDSTRFIAKRAQSENAREFLSSKDPWFRPANISVGPDGSLYIIDMYRQHIETPVSIPDDLKADMDFLRGQDYGRIYRIIPKNNSAAKQAALDLKHMSSKELVNMLASPKQWFAFNAQRLLLERQDQSVVPEVRNMFKTHQEPLARVHALFVLEALNALVVADVRQGVKDINPEVRRNALILAERYPELASLVSEATNDSIASVALQATLSLGSFKERPGAALLNTIVEKHVGDPWFRLAILTTNAGSSISFLSYLNKQSDFFKSTTREKEFFIEDISSVVGYRNTPGEIYSLLQLLSEPGLPMKQSWERAALTGLAKGLKKLKIKPAMDEKINLSLKRMELENKESITAIKEIRSAFQ